MIFLLDTTIFSELMRRNPNVTHRLRRIQSGDRVIISTITFGEIRFGINRLPGGRRKTALEREFLHLLAHIPCFGIPPEAGILYGELKLKAIRSSPVLDENDLWIASHGMTLNATVVTSDTGYRRLPGLDTADWSH